ncbi:MAG: ribosome maturation factor RimM [Gammaproteobacteria bacterium]|nr:ribosome maturation factor RimM [Gammaproteobacteria bacterium]
MGGGEPDRLIILGRIAGLYGVAGWVRVVSYTRPREAIVGYSPWHLRRGQGWRAREVREGRRRGSRVIARLAGCENRDAARALIGADIAVRRGQLPPTAPGEYYWADLIGLAVETLDGAALGEVAGVMETGANDVLVVRGERERLIPFVQDEVVKAVDLEAGVVRVDWDPAF